MTQLNLQKWGNSQGISLPKKLLTEVGVTSVDGAVFDAIVEDGCIKLTPVNQPTPYEQLFKDYHGEKPEKITDWDNAEPKGKEIW